MIAELADAISSLASWPRFRASTTSSPAQWFIDWAQGGSSTDSGINITADTALTYAPVYQAVSILAGDVGQLPLDLYKREGEQNKEKAKTHPAYRVMRRRANDFMSAGTFRETLMYYALFWGNGCAEIERDNAGRPRALWPLLPDRTSLVVEGGQPWYITRAGGREFRLRHRDVFHIRNFGFDGLWGYSTLTLARNSIALGLAAGKYAGKYFDNNGMPSGVLEHPTELSDPAYNKLKRDWAASHEGLDNSARIAILEEGTKFTATAFNQKDSQWLEGRGFSREEVAEWFNLPPHKIGAMDHATFTNIEEQNRDYLNTSLMRWLVKWQDEGNDKLLTERDKSADTHFFEFNTAALLRGDLKSRYEAYSIGTQNAWLSPNEVRAAENLNSYPGGDEYRAPLNMGSASGNGESDDDTDDDSDDDSTDKFTARLEAEFNAGMGRAAEACERFESGVADVVHRSEAKLKDRMVEFRGDVDKSLETSLAEFAAAMGNTGNKVCGVVEADIAEEMSAFRASLKVACTSSVNDHAAKMTDVGLLSLEAFTGDANKVVAGLIDECVVDAEQTLRCMRQTTIVEGKIDSMIRCEVSRVGHAAKTSKNFCEFLDRFYDDWPAKVARSLQGYAEHPDAIAAWAAESKAVCLEVAGKVTDAEGLEEAISLAVATWPKRAEGLAGMILKDK